MKALRLFWRRTSTVSAKFPSLYTPRSYSSLPLRRKSPFLDLFERHKDHRSVRHLLLRRRKYSSQSEPKDLDPSEPRKSYSQRFKDLSRKYGWAALGTYIGLTILDYPFFFLAVRAMGTERIGQYEHTVVEWFKATMPFEIPKIKWPWQKQEMEGDEAGNAHGRKPTGAQSKGDKEEASLWTQALIAYAFHKSFIFLRVPLAVAITPRVVKTLRAWGWNIGKQPPKPGRIPAQNGK